MRKRFGLNIISVLVLLCAGASMPAQQPQNRTTTRPAPAADLKLKYRTTVSGQTNESVTMLKGARERSETNWGAGSMVNITQCDLKRTIQISDQARKYIITPMQTAASEDRQPASTPGAAGPARRGGVVTYTSTATDTGERKEMFGFTARHVKTSIAIESSPDACYPMKQRMETDGWYIDLAVGLDCDLGRAQAMSRPAMAGGCQDQTRFKRAGTARTGYPLSETTTMYGPNGAVSFTSTKEVVELSRDPLDASLFDIPAGYTEAQSMQELYGMPSMDATGMPGTPQSTSSDTSSSAEQKNSGVVRIGVVPFNNKTDKSVSTDSLRDRLISEIQNAGVEAVPLNALTQMAAEAEAKTKQCDYILFTDISALKSSKIGGMLGRVTGAGGGKTDARLDFKLLAVGQSVPVLQSLATGKDDGEDASAGAATDVEAKMVTAAVKKGRP